MVLKINKKDGNVSTATSSIIASFLAVLAKNGNTQQMRNLLEQAGNLDILSNIGNICDDKASKDQQRIGDEFTQQLLGDKAADFTAPIANKACISKVATNRLISIIAPVIAGFLGNRIVNENGSLNKILGEIENQKSSFASYIPAELLNSFGLSSWVTNRKVDDTVKKEYVTTEPEKKKGKGWLTWLILILLLLLLLFLWRSCRHNRTNDMYYEPVEVTDTVTTTIEPVNTAYSRNMTELTLPNGVRLHAYEGGIEEEILDFLNSDNFADASDDELREHWFEFDNINFKYGSSTELMGDSQEQLDNIASILKYYKNAKIKIAGFADRRGSEEANMALSQERAKTIEAMLDKAGVGAQVVKTEGYGEEYAVYSENAPDSERREDRDIALRFVR